VVIGKMRGRLKYSVMLRKLRLKATTSSRKNSSNKL